MRVHSLCSLLLTTLLTTTLFLFLSTPASAQITPTYNDTILLEGISPYASAADSEGNIYYTGIFAGTNVNFNPAGTDLHSSNGSDDIFLTKYAADGSYGWTKTWGGTRWDSGNSVAVDSLGNVYVTGFFEGTSVNFNPAGTDLHSSNGGFDIFLTKYLSDGSYAWTQTWGGTGDDLVGGGDSGNSVAVDSLGSVYVTGNFRGTSVNFNPAGTDLHSSNGGFDIFLTKYLSDGSYAWTQTWGGTGDDYGYSLGIDSSNSVYVTGNFRGTSVNFNPAGTDLHSSNGSADIFLTKYTADGTYGWTKTWGGTGSDSGYSVTIDSLGSVYVTGSFAGTNVNFNPAGTDLHSSNGDSDIFLTKYTADGTYGWTQTWGGTGYEDNSWSHALHISADNTIYITGSFEDTVDFDPGPGVVERTGYPAGEYALNVFITALTTEGSYLWVRTFGTADYDRGVSVLTHNNTLYVTGYVRFGLYPEAQNIDFNPDGDGDVRTVSTRSGFITTYLLPVTEEEAPDATVSAATLTLHRSDPRPPPCSASTPAAPDLFQINTQSTTAHLYFTPPSAEHDSYYLAFGHSEGEQLYGGAFAIGRQTGVARIHVTELTPNTTYYFTLRAQNDCMPGSWSTSQKAITTPAFATYSSIFYKYSIVIDRIFQRLNLPWWWE